MRHLFSFVFLVVLAAPNAACAADQTIAEFRKDATGKLSGISDVRLDEIIKRIDANADGTVSDDEFTKRVKIFRDVMKGPEPWRTDLKKSRAAAEKSGKPLLIFARADWCGACAAVEKTMLPAAQVQQALAGFVLCRLDIDKQPKEAEALQIEAIPTFIIEGSAAPESGRQVGAGADSLVALLNKNRETASPPKPASKNTPVRLRVLSYNIHHGEGIDRKLDLDRIAKVIQSVKPDIVALQEVDKNCKRSATVDQPAELARLTKMNVVFAKNIPLGTGEYGNALLTRFPIDSQKNHKLPNFEKGEQRGLLDVMLKVPGGSLRFLATHFDHRTISKERVASAKVVNALLKQKPELPTLLAGDLNAVPESEPLRILKQHWMQTNTVESLTVPVADPTRQIDYVLASPASHWKVIETKVLAEAIASDHRAFLAVLELNPLPQAAPAAKPGDKQKADTP